MKVNYLDLMEEVIAKYSKERICEYIAKTREQGITEHGFPRLCANIGILLSHGRCDKLQHYFEEMMEICCRDLPAYTPQKSRRGNDFSIREIVCSIVELEASGKYAPDTISHWKNCLKQIVPPDCYKMVAPFPPVAVGNWAAFNAASEQVRCHYDLADTHEFIENQIASQMFSFDENGMYRDPNDPMVYDFVTRNMLATCLYYGYNGSHRPMIEAHLKKAGQLSLHMQSVNGEFPYGGRSNQFLHNEAHMAVTFEYMATSAMKAGDVSLSGMYKAAANLSVQQLRYWLQVAPGHHVKNYYHHDSGLGCENYAYYDKYMVTVASFLYLAYVFCDDSIISTTCPAVDDKCYTFQTSEAFRKLFCKAADYFLELETKSDHHYDAEGIGRIHRRGAPPALCLSVSAPTAPNYKIEPPNSLPLSICWGKQTDDGWKYAFDPDFTTKILHHSHDDHSVFASLTSQLSDENEVVTNISMDSSGVNIEVTGAGVVGLLLPAFFFDGEKHTQINQYQNSLTVVYQGWSCRYEGSVALENLNLVSANRNGLYKLYRISAENKINVHISIQVDTN